MSFTAQSSLPKVYTTYDFIHPSHVTNTLRGKVALITGASAGLGRAACLAFAAAGASIACLARRPDPLNDLTTHIQSTYDVPALALPGDLTDPSTPARVAAAVEHNLGPVDILLNCAGITRMSTLHAEPAFATWWRVFETNVRGAAALTHAVLPAMVRRRTGIVMAVSSSAAHLEIPFTTAYSASKAAVTKFQADLAREVGRYGVLSFSIHPGTVATDLAAVESAVNRESIAEEPEAGKLMQEFREMKYQTPELMADTAVVLCAMERCGVLSGRYVDCEQRLDEVLKEAEKEGGGRVERERLYKLKIDEL